LRRAGAAAGIAEFAEGSEKFGMWDGSGPVRLETDAGGTTDGIARSAPRTGPFPLRVGACRYAIDSRDYLFTTRTDGSQAALQTDASQAI